MKILKRDSKLYQDILEVEKLLLSKGLEIQKNPTGIGGLMIKHISTGDEFEFIDIDDGSGADQFPYPFEYSLKLSE